jgi:DNA polymerase-3 subunit gamma/tau
MIQAIYRRYRPRAWHEVTGQDHIVLTLKNAIAQDHVGHAYLFAGPRGTGKTTLARILAKAVNCLADDPAARPCNSCEHCVAVNENRYLDLIEMDAASNTGVDDVRELRDKIGFAPSQGRYKVYIVDEVHMLSTAAFNALLKTLEEPPPHAIFILATTEIHKIPATVLSRCQRHEFRRVPVGEIVTNLRRIVDQEGWQADEDALVLIARQATGSVRDAQSLLDQLASSDANITLDLAQPVLGTATSQTVIDMVEAIRDRKTASGLMALRAAFDSGVDPRSLARQVVEYLRALMLIQMGNAKQVEVGKELRERMQAHAAALAPVRVIRLIRAFNTAATDARGAWQPSLALELAVAEAMEGSPDAPPSAPGTLPGSTVGKRAAAPDPEPKPGGIPKRVSEPAAETATPRSVPATQAVRSGAGDADLSNPEGRPVRAIELAEVIGAWKAIRSVLKRTHPAADGLLNSSKPIEIRGNELIVGFQTDAVRAIMDRPENMEAARRAIVEVLGRPLQIRCLVISAGGKAPPNMAQDGMVATALNHGGEIVDIQE